VSTTGIFTDGLGYPEGPVVLPDGDWLVVESAADRGCVTWISRDGKRKRVLGKTGRPNGLAVDREGMIWIAESHPAPAVLRMDFRGKVEVVATSSPDGPFLLPNDLCFGPNGNLFVTDSGVLFADLAPGRKIRSDYENLAYDGKVYEIDPGTGHVATIDRGLRLTNGIAFGPDGLLYVNDTVTGSVYRYETASDGAEYHRVEFGTVNDAALPSGFGPGGFRGPDGMAFGIDGTCFVAVVGQQDVTVLGADGGVESRVKTAGKFPTNVAFGSESSKRIYVTEAEAGVIEYFDVDVNGVTLYS
jgi:gluconolactonase